MKKNKIAKTSGLGSGLSSLLGSEFEKKSILSENVTEEYKMIPIEFIQPGHMTKRRKHLSRRLPFEPQMSYRCCTSGSTVRYS